ncbi:MAG: DNA polymerase III subunit delta, partial [Candidatus Promineifilaceae bacterium]|nr:DNA polymerase III subunit delta [Candidatus Promineifilaceae bacterium]
MFYLFHGDDEHSIRETLADLQSKLGDPDMLELNTTRFNGAGLSLADLQLACDALPFLADKRLVIVTDLLASKPDYLDRLLTYLPNLPETTRLVFIENRALPGNHRLVRLAKEAPTGFERVFKRPQGGQLEGWIRQRVQEAGGTMTGPAVQLLAANAGNDLAILDNEIEKLVLYRQDQPIGPDDVSLLCPYVAEASIFDLVDAIGERNGSKAARLLHKKLTEGADPFYLFAMIVRQFRLLIQTKELAEDGRRAPAIADALHIHGFV